MVSFLTENILRVLGFYLRVFILNPEIIHIYRLIFENKMSEIQLKIFTCSSNFV